MQSQPVGKLQRVCRPNDQRKEFSCFSWKSISCVPKEWPRAKDTGREVLEKARSLSRGETVIKQAQKGAVAVKVHRPNSG